MAGIGFELKKIFKERSVLNLIRGTFYSAFTVIGPMLIIIICYMLLLIITQYQHVDYYQKDMLTSLILYAFIFSLILTSPLAAVVSRFIADKIFEEKTSDILSCYFIGLLINVIIGAAFCIPFIFATIIRGGADPLIMLLAGCMFMALLFVFYNMTFISALKEYKSIAYSFIVGMAVTLALSYTLHIILNMQFLFSVLAGMSAGFMSIAFILFALIRGFFKENSNNYKEFISYLWQYKLLFLANMFYILGLYAHNFVFWNVPDLSIVIAATMRSAPVYDTATFLAMMTNVSATVFFTVRVEINFHDRYQSYCQQILGGIGKDIVVAKNNMFSVLVKEIEYLIQFQAAFSIIVFLIVMIFASYFGFGGLIMTIYPVLTAGYFVLYIMYGMIVFLYYFNDRTGAFLSSLTFFAVTLAVSIFATGLRQNLYGIGLFAGAFAGWTVSFIRLKMTERNLDRMIFCRGELLRRVYAKPIKTARKRKAGKAS